MGYKNRKRMSSGVREMRGHLGFGGFIDLEEGTGIWTLSDSEITGEKKGRTQEKRRRMQK